MTAKLLSATLILAVLASGQTWKAPRTADGQPDIQGVWSTATTTPLERPAEFAGKPTLTPAEAAEYQKKAIYDVNGDRCDGGGAADVGRAYNEFWRERGKVVPDLRTSLITDPPDGKIPPLTQEAQKRQAERAAAARGHEFDGPENRNLQERCLVANNVGPPMTPANYSANYQIAQGPGWVVLVNEMAHDARIIRWMGVRTSRKTFASGLATRAAIGRVIRWWSRPPTSPTKLFPWIERQDAPGGTLHAHRRRYAPVRIHSRRSGDLR